MRTVSSSEAYREWASSFDDPASPLLALESRVVEPLLGDVRGLRTLDIGCGTGRWTSLLLDRGAVVTGLDASPEMLDEARRKTGIAGRLVRGDGRTPPFRARSARLVLCCLTIGHLQPVRSTLRALGNLLAPGGRLIVTDFHPDALRRGWKRTYRHGGETVAIESQPYALANLTAPGLKLASLAEPCFGDSERGFFSDAGRMDLFEAARGLPAIYAAAFDRSEA